MTRPLLFALWTGAALFPVYGQDARATRDQADRILSELREIRRLLEDREKPAAPPPRQPPANLVLDIGDSPVLGSPGAPVTIVEFTDYQCPFCQRFQLAILPLLQRDYIDTGKVRFISRDLPLEQIHPYAHIAAQAARCAGDQGQFWEMRDRMQRSVEALELPRIIGFADALKLDLAQFRACLADGRHRAAVERDAREAMTFNVDSTPSFVIGKSTPTGVDGDLVSGILPYEVFSAKVKALLR